MAIIPQVTLFEYSELEELGDLERFKLALEGIDDEELMRKLEKRRKNGRDDFPVRVMWNLLIAMIICEYKLVSSFLRELNRNSQLRRVCGLFDRAGRKNLTPPPRVFTGFFKTLIEFQDDVEQIFDTQVINLYGLLPGFGETTAGDGKYIDSVANRKPKDESTKEKAGNRRDNNAEWSTKEYHYKDTDGKKKVKKEYHFGFKAHIICDVNYELPIVHSVTPANADEKKEMLKLLQSPVLSSEEHKKVAKHLLLDRGYDSGKMIKGIKAAGMIPVVDIRNCWKDGEETKQYKNTDMVYNAYGEVSHYDYVEKYDKETETTKREYLPVKMKYEGYDKQKNCLRYSHKGKTKQISISYDERIFLPIARDSDKFKRIYKGRTAVERLNGRLDRDYMFEKHYIRGLDKMRLMVSLSLIVMNGMAIGKIKNNIDSIRSLKKAS